MMAQTENGKSAGKSPCVMMHRHQHHDVYNCAVEVENMVFQWSAVTDEVKWQLMDWSSCNETGLLSSREFTLSLDNRWIT